MPLCGQRIKRRYTASFQKGKRISNSKIRSVKVSDILCDPSGSMGLRLIAGKKGLSREITVPRIQKPSIALAGYLEQIHPDRVQVLGNVELSYLSTLNREQKEDAIKKLCSLDIACFIITRGLPAPKYLLQEASRKGIAVLRTELVSSVLITMVNKFLEERLAETVHMHGVLVDVLEVGILILGKSGIGKSECALDLVMKGHRLIADDIIEIKKSFPSYLIGRGNEMIKYHMEIRGLGIINVKDLFGITAIRDEKRIELIIELLEWSKDGHDRLGLDRNTSCILGIDITYIQVPVSPGRSMATIVEVAARNHLLQKSGRHTSREFNEKLTAQIDRNRLQVQTVKGRTPKA